MIFEGNQYQPVNPDESVLDCLLRNQVKVSYSCKTGNCQSCLVRSLEGEVSKKGQKGLKATMASQGFFLACQQSASSIIEAASIESDLLFSHATLIEKNKLSNKVYQFIINPVSPIYYHAGQFINLKNVNGVIRSYSIASVPSEDQYIELHIQGKYNGKMTQWLINDFKVGDTIDFQGPIGNCFYIPQSKEQPIILIGSNTGAAPLLGIIRDALRSKHQNQIVFYHGASTLEGLYLHRQLIELEQLHTNFKYNPCITTEQTIDFTEKQIRIGYCNELALDDLTSFDGDIASLVLYICGNPEMVKETRKLAFISGVSSKNIFVDPFEYQDLRQVSR